MNRLVNYNATRLTGPRVVSILSGKGGVGKSVIALNLAERLQAAGFSVLLVDLDLYGGNLHVLTNARPQAGIVDYVQRTATLTSAITTLSNGLDLVANSETVPPAEVLAMREPAGLVQRLRTDAVHYDWIICDHSSGVSEFAAALAGASDLNLLIAVPELTSISDCYGLWKFLCKMDRAVDGRLLINRAESAEEAEYVAHRLAVLAERFLGHPLQSIGFLPEDKAVRQAVAAQSTVVRIKPQSSVIQKLNELTQVLSGGRSPAVPELPTSTINENAAPADTKG